MPFQVTLVHYSTHLAPLPLLLIQEVAALSDLVFLPPAIDCTWRLTRMPEVTVFCARRSDRLIGFKAGYATAERRYYSWLGAVLPGHRQQGVATELARLQHQWLTDQGYSSVETASSDSNAAMARVNLASGFTVVGTKLEAHGQQVLWSKKLA